MSGECFLTREAVWRLTKRKQFAAQRRALDRLGIRYTAASDGEPLVRADYDLDDGRRRARNLGPRWDRISQ